MSDDALDLALAERAYSELLQAYEKVASTAEGKRVLFDILEQCAIYREAFAGDSAAVTNYTLGLQAAGRRVIGRLDEVDPRIYPRLCLDIADIKASDRAAVERAAKLEDDDDAE